MMSPSWTQRLSLHLPRLHECIPIVLLRAELKPEGQKLTKACDLPHESWLTEKRSHKSHHVKALVICLSKEGS